MLTSSAIRMQPCLFLALDYMLLARMAVFLDAGDALPIRASRLSKVFVTADVVTFIAQLGAGGMLGMATSNPDLADIGTKVGEPEPCFGGQISPLSPTAGHDRRSHRPGQLLRHVHHYPDRLGLTRAQPIPREVGCTNGPAQ